jgi:hypothetical protein
MKTVACVICAALIGLVALPEAQRAVEGFQADLRENLACTAATYAALDGDATEADFERANELCPAESEPAEGARVLGAAS